jgi:hypothetical protein
VTVKPLRAVAPWKEKKIVLWRPMFTVTIYLDINNKN